MGKRTKFLEGKVDDFKISLQKSRIKFILGIFCVIQTITFSPPILRAEYWVWMSECNIIYEALGLRVSMVMMLDMTRLVMILSFSKPDNTNPPRFYIHLFVNTENNFYDALHNGIWFVYDSSAHPINPRYESHKRLKVPLPSYNCNTEMAISYLFLQVTPPWVQCQVSSPSWMQFLIPGLCLPEMIINVTNTL